MSSLLDDTALVQDYERAHGRTVDKRCAMTTAVRPAISVQGAS